MLFCPYEEMSPEKGDCVYDNDSTYFCGDYCNHISQSCNGTCTDGWLSCDHDYYGEFYGDNYGNVPILSQHAQRQNDYGNATICIKNGTQSSQYKICNETCINSWNTCDGACSDGSYKCNDFCMENYNQCNNQCPDGWEQCGRYQCTKEDSPNSPYRSCGDRCIGKYEACNDTCPDGMLACGDWNNEWNAQKLCYNSESINQPCNGVCL
jgi:hypothetical protein